MITYNEIYMASRNALRSAGIEAHEIEAKILVAKAAGKTYTELMRDLTLYTSSTVAQKAAEYTKRRLNGEPVAYITGNWEFYGIPLEINSDVLIPRMDTEVLVDTVKEAFSGNMMNPRILDLCCGSGCISCAIARILPGAKLMAIDISAGALEVCRRNLALNNLSSRVICMQADATVSPPMGMGSFDMIVSNPPYIPTDEIPGLDNSVKDYEPVWALDGGKDGMKFYKSIIKYWKSLLKPGGYILFEVGEGQADTVREMLLAASFSDTDTRKDTLGIDRVVIGKM